MRNRLLIALALLAWCGFVGWGLSHAETNIEDFFPWLPDDAPVRAEYIDFINNFGSDDVLIVSWEGCRLGDPRVDKSRRALLESGQRWVRDVTTAEPVINELMRPPSRMGRQQVIDKLTSILIGPDGQTTCLFVHLTDVAMRDRQGAVSRIIQQLSQTTGLPPSELYLGGHPYVGYYSAQQTRDSLMWLSIPVGLLSTLLAWACLRKRRLMFITFAAGSMAAMTSLAIIPWAGYRVNGLLSALPSLIYVITTSGVIHVVNYSLGLRRQDREAGLASTPQAHAAAIRNKAWRACTLSSISTALGTLSLVWSDFPAIREFGVFGTIGVALTYIIHLVLLPIVLAHTFPRDAATVADDPFVNLFARLFDFLVRWKGSIIIGAFALVATFAYSLFHLEGRFTLDQMFRPESEFVRNIRWLESHVGPIDATEVLVRFDNVGEVGFYSRAARIHRLEKALQTAPGVVSTFSAVSLIPAFDYPPSVLGVFMTRNALERQRTRLLGGSHLVQAGNSEIWRLTLRSRLFDGIPRGELMRGVRDRVAETCAEWTPAPAIVFTGGSQIFYETQFDVLRDFAESLLSAYLMILVMMAVALRSVSGGLLSMFPNIVPCIVVFGLLGWIDRGIDVGMTVAGCIALGIAVDNTAHLIMLFREMRRVEPDRLAALRLAYRQSATAVFQTSIICGAAMLPYVFATLRYLSRFGLLMSSLMLAAMLCDLLLTPSIIASRVGKCFDPPPESSGDADDPDTPGDEDADTSRL